MASPVKAKKHLGQHFLIDLNIAQKIVNALPQDELAVLEIGPGTGVLTQYLIEKDNFTAFDIDTESIEFLKHKYPQHQHKVQFQDFLEADYLLKHDIKVVFQDYQHKSYQQLWGDFVPYMSILDLLMNHGKDSLKYIVTSSIERKPRNSY